MIQNEGEKGIDSSEQQLMGADNCLAFVSDNKSDQEVDHETFNIINSPSTKRSIQVAVPV